MSDENRLYYSERKLWDECPAARPALERLARHRQRYAAVLERNLTLEEALRENHADWRPGDR